MNLLTLEVGRDVEATCLCSHLQQTPPNFSVKQASLASQAIVRLHIYWRVPEYQTNVFSLPFWLVPRDIKSSAAPCLSIAPAQSLILCIFPALCGSRKRVVLIERLLDLSNLGNLRWRNPASLPLNYPVGTCLLKEVISRCFPGLVMCIRTESQNSIETIVFHINRNIIIQHKINNSDFHASCYSLRMTKDCHLYREMFYSDNARK